MYYCRFSALLPFQLPRELDNLHEEILDFQLLCNDEKPECLEKFRSSRSRRLRHYSSQNGHHLALSIIYERSRSLLLFLSTLPGSKVGFGNSRTPTPKRKKFGKFIITG